MKGKILFHYMMLFIAMSVCVSCAMTEKFPNNECSPCKIGINNECTEQLYFECARFFDWKLPHQLVEAHIKGDYNTKLEKLLFYYYSSQDRYDDYFAEQLIATGDFNIIGVENLRRYVKRNNHNCKIIREMLFAIINTVDEVESNSNAGTTDYNKINEAIKILLSFDDAELKNIFRNLFVINNDIVLNMIVTQIKPHHMKYAYPDLLKLAKYDEMYIGDTAAKKIIEYKNDDNDAIARAKKMVTHKDAFVAINGLHILSVANEDGIQKIAGEFLEQHKNNIDMDNDVNIILLLCVITLMQEKPPIIKLKPYIMSSDVTVQEQTITACYSYGKEECNALLKLIEPELQYPLMFYIRDYNN